MIHELKIDSDEFNAIISGKQSFIFSDNDRPFNVGDLLALNESDSQCCSGNSCIVYVDLIMLSDEYLKNDKVVMAIKPCSVYRHTEPFSLNKLSKDYSVPSATKEG